MQINLDKFGRLPEGCPTVFYRVEAWAGSRIADFTTHGEAAAFAIADAQAKGCRYDHKVSKMTIVYGRGR